MRIADRRTCIAHGLPSLIASMRELRPLRLPQLLEARKKEDINMSPESQQSQTTASSDFPSPNTPTFSLRGHARFPSSTSSLASSPVMRDSMDGFGSSKRPLTEVREDPQERDDDYEMVESPESSYHEDCKSKNSALHDYCITANSSW